MSIPSCQGPCKQGRAECPSKQACRIAIVDDGGEWTAVTWGEAAAFFAPLALAIGSVAVLWVLFT
jgi:hypothetical protein